jgi:hypothetical protein
MLSLNYLINFQIIPSDPYTRTFFFLFLVIFVYVLIIVVDKVFEIFYKTKINITLFSFYLIFQILFLIIIIFYLLYGYPIYRDIYFYLKNLMIIKLIPLESEFIMFYTTTIFFFLILTIIFISIILINSYRTKEFLIFNSILNIQIILFFIIFGIVGIIYSFLLSNLTYTNIINLADVYLTVVYLSNLLLLLIIILNKINFYYVSIRGKMRARKFFNNFKKDSPVYIKIYMMNIPFLFAILQYFSFNAYGFIQAPIPWLTIIFMVFYFYIVFKILIKKLKKETFYQGLYILNKYFNIRLFIVFGILTFVAILDSLNFILLKNYTIQNILQPTMSLSTINQDLIFQSLIIVSSVFLVCSFLPFFVYYHFIYPDLHYFHYYILAENIGHKVEEGYVKISQVNPMITILSYLALLIVFLINLIL